MSYTFTETANSIFATTFRHAKKKIVDNIVVDSVYLAMLGQKDLAASLRKSRVSGDSKQFGEGIELMDDPGFEIQFPIMFAKNTTTASYASFDILNTTPQDPFTVALYPWRSYAATVNLCNEDLDKNSGSKTKIVDFMEAHIENARLSIVDSVTDMLLGARDASSSETWGLLDIVKDDPTTNPAGGNLGSIDASTNTWWRNQISNFASAAFGTGGAADGCQALRQLIYACTFGTKRPSVLMGGNNAFESLMSALAVENRYMNEGAMKLANMGFDAITFQNIPVVREPKVLTVRAAASLTGDAFYALHLEYLKVFGHKKRWFEPSDSIQPYNQDTNVMHIITRLQHATNARRQLGVMFAIAAP